MDYVTQALPSEQQRLPYTGKYTHAVIIHNPKVMMKNNITKSHQLDFAKCNGLKTDFLKHVHYTHYKGVITISFPTVEH